MKQVKEIRTKITTEADLTTAFNGALAGLVAITAEPLVPTPIGVTLIGPVGGLLVVHSIVTQDKLRVDDSLGAIYVRGPPVCGACSQFRYTTTMQLQAPSCLVCFTYCAESSARASLSGR